MAGVIMKIVIMIKAKWIEGKLMVTRSTAAATEIMKNRKKKPPLKGNVTQLKGKRNEVSVTKIPATVACKSIRKSHSLSAQFYEMHGQAPSS